MPKRALIRLEQFTPGVSISIPFGPDEPLIKAATMVNRGNSLLDKMRGYSRKAILGAVKLPGLRLKKFPFDGEERNEELENPKNLAEFKAWVRKREAEISASYFGRFTNGTISKTDSTYGGIASRKECEAINDLRTVLKMVEVYETEVQAGNPMG